MLHYILQTIAFQLFFLIIYDAFLKRDTFFDWNRTYLLGTMVLSIILPIIKIEQFKDVVPQEFIIALPEIILGNLSQIEPNTVLETGMQQSSGFVFTWQMLFYTGALIALGMFVYKLIKIGVLIYKNPKRWKGDLLIVKLINSSAAFSFFYYVFLGEQIKAHDKAIILKHETIHVQQRHTLDLLLFEVLRILFWFNPLVYMYQKRITTLHEYIADADAVKTQDKSDYYENLLAQTFETQNVSFINSFFKQSLIKKRIIMLSKTKSKQISKLKYILLVPVVFGMLIYTSSFAQEKNQESSDVKLKEKIIKELIQLEKNGNGFFEKDDAFKSDKSNYVNTREEYYRFQVWVKRLYDNSKIKRDRPNEFLNKTYAEYLEWKKTDDAKERWESGTHDGVLRLVVNDFDNLTEAEIKRKSDKKKLIKKDVFFTKLLIRDVNGKGFHVEYSPNEFSMANSKDDSKAIALNEVDLEVGFAVVEHVPVYPGCETFATNDERKKCMADKITKHVQTNFNTDLAGDLGLIGRQRISVIFKINKEGNIVGIRSRAAHPELEKEAVRIISLLPKMIPGKHGGENVIVPYSLPIIFEVAEKNEESKEKSQESKVVNSDGSMPFAIVDEAPVFQGCENLSAKDEQKKCTSDKINKLMQKNFNTNLPSKLGLKGKQRIDVILKIDKQGKINIDRIRAQHPRLEEEAKRVVNLLPKMKPGKHRGENVIVSYSLPIIFQIQE